MIRWALRTIFRLLALAIVALAILLAFLYVNDPKPKEGKDWTRGTNMPLLRGEVASAILNGRLVMVGGLRGFTTTSRAVSIYKVSNDTWSDGPALPAARHHAAAAAWDRRIYVSGGAATVRDWSPRKDVWELRPGGGWTKLPQMPEGRQGHAMVAHDGHLYVVGGSGRTNRTEIYDISKKKWSLGAPLSDGRNHLRAVAWDGKVWAIGGRSSALTAHVDIYDPLRDTWAPGPPLPEPMSAMAVGVVGDELHVLGGEDPAPAGGKVLKSHYALEADAQKWEKRPSSPLPVHGAGYGSDGRRLIVAGGASRPGALSTISWTGVTQIYEP
jgi:N-acetylneuraminic acid mutarotase